MIDTRGLNNVVKSRRKYNRRSGDGIKPTSVNRRWRQAASASKGRKIPFDISLEYFKDLIGQRCAYCNKNANPLTTGSYMDRVNNSAGYLETNVVPCCSRCNRMKNDMTVREFFEHIKTVVRHLTKLERGCKNGRSE